MNEFRNGQVVSILVELLRDGAGVVVQDTDRDRRFIDLGLDSLFLTQFSVSVNRRFGTSLTFRQVATEFDTLAKLATHLGETGAQPVVAQASQNGATVRDSRDLDALVRLFLGQVAVMQQQLDALCGVAASAPKPREADAHDPLLDAAHPPVPGARLGRDASGKPAWYVPKPGHPGKFVKHG